jgi:4-amino-4-deoxy-L-arabinose transferase-like glycosyltransferase/O-antigen/teichoic acid export membrane protein
VNVAAPLAAGTTTTVRRRLAVATGRTQLTLMAAQLLAGAGNLLVSLLAARMLAPGEYAALVTFLALYLAVHVPAAALSAAGAVDPRRAHAVHSRAVAVAACLAVVAAVVSAPIGAAVGLPARMIVLLAVALPGAAALGLARGAAYARHDVASVRASLLAEPLSRCVLGVALMVPFGATGGAAAAVLGGYLALGACHGRLGRWNVTARPVMRRAAPGAAGPAGPAVGVGVSFVALAVLQTVDLLVANARLDDVSAGRFGALSTIGGAAAFATATVPLVLLPASARGDARARSGALRLAITVGVAVAAFGWLLSGPLLRVAVGGELAGEAAWLGPYLVAMAAFGVVRVLIATRWTDGDGAFALRALVTALALHFVFLVGFGVTVATVVLCTVATTCGLAATLGFARQPDAGAAPGAAVPVIPRRGAATCPPSGPYSLAAPTTGATVRAWIAARRDVLALTGLCAVAAVVRLANSRGLWVDEAISVRQAQLPFGEMIADVRVSDVHPPLHHAILWLDVRLFGTSELAARLPSLVAGVLLVPALRWVGEVVYDRRTGWIAACLAAIAPFCVWYSQEARMYSLFMLFATVAVGAQVQALRHGRRADWILYAGATAALMWTQYFAVLPIAVQQLAFGVAAWRRRRDRRALARFGRSWAASAALAVAAVLPLLPILHDQWVGYANRSSGLVPGQAGAASSALGDNISIYAVLANLIWAVWGYHSDATMVQIAALWPLLMLLGLVLLGRGRSGRSVLLSGLVVVPLAALFVIGSTKRDLFELRYFSGAVPVTLLLCARVVTAIARRRLALVAAGALAATTLGVGLVDQQLNGANPRLYDFEGALAEVHAGDDRDTAVLLYAPDYLGDVIAYYAPELDTRPLGAPIPADASTVWVLASENILDVEPSSGRIGSVLADLEQHRQLVSTIRRPNVRVWELR